MMITRGKLVVVDNFHSRGPRQVKFTFNPSKLKVTGGSKWDQPPSSGAKAASPPQFKGSDPRSMDLELTLEGWEMTGAQHDEFYNVYLAVKTLISWTQPNEKTRTTKKPTAPIVMLRWGKTQWFACYVGSVNATFTMFDHVGTPVRATVALSLKEVPNWTEKQNPTSGSRVGHQSHLVVAGDSLPLIAFQYYERAPLWRGIALANNLDDPMRLRVGSRLSLPPIEDVVAMSN
jgi:hypothetical protein